MIKLFFIKPGFQILVQKIHVKVEKMIVNGEIHSFSGDIKFLIVCLSFWLFSLTVAVIAVHTLWQSADLGKKVSYLLKSVITHMFL